MMEKGAAGRILRSESEDALKNSPNRPARPSQATSLEDGREEKKISITAPPTAPMSKREELEGAGVKRRFDCLPESPLTRGHVSNRDLHKRNVEKKCPDHEEPAAVPEADARLKERAGTERSALSSNAERCDRKSKREGAHKQITFDDKQMG